MFLLPLFFALLASFAKDGAAGTPKTGAAAATVNKTVLLQLVNEARKKGCNCGDAYYGPAPALSWNEQLETAAANHSNDMFQNHYFSHTAPDGTNGGDRILQAGYSWKFYGENIAEGFRSEQEVVDGWLASPGHCKNIMNKNYREMAVARAGNYWTQELGAR
jgi:uncharacterized protein YkwD